MSKMILKSLFLSNFATFENQYIDFNDNFVSIIGETGSGKSLICDAFQLLLGQRADKKLIRKSCEFSTLEGTFQFQDKKIAEYFDKLGFPVIENEIVIKRIIYNTGRSKSFLNHLSCPLSILLDFSKKFVDLVGQFENQKLLSPDYQLILLDKFAGLSSNSEKFELEFKAYKDILTQLDKNQSLLASKIERQDYVEFQLKQMDELIPSVEDETNLVKEKEDLLNLENDKQIILSSINLLEENNQGILSSLSTIDKNISIAKFTEKNNVEKLIGDAKLLLEEATYKLSSLATSDNSGERLNEIIDRLDSYQKLKRRFNCETSQLEVIQKEFSTERDTILELEKSIKSLTQKAKISKSALMESAHTLHDRRTKAAKRLSSLITKFVQNLNMEGSTIELKLVDSELSKSGISSIEFMAETNSGEGFYKVKDIASGGELSRILLALRQVVSSNESISIFFFDEIDTGVGGDTAKKIGKALKEVSESSQVLAITHLPQIANFSEQLVLVDKTTIADGKKSKRTVSHAKIIRGKDKTQFIKELAKFD